MVEANLGTSVIPEISDSHHTVVSFILPCESGGLRGQVEKSYVPLGFTPLQPVGPIGSCPHEGSFVGVFFANDEELFAF